MNLFLSLLIFLAVTLVVILGHSLYIGRKSSVSKRLADIQKIKIVDEEAELEDSLNKPFSERLIQPLFIKIGETIRNLTPKEIQNNIERKILYAGSTKTLNLNRFLVIQFFFFFIFFGISMLIFSLLPDFSGARAIVLALVMGLIGLFIPMIVLNFMAAKRQLEIQKSLPDILDLILVSVEAGLGFDLALKRVAAQSEKSIAMEISRALDEMRMGKSREEALRGIVHRTGVPDLSSFISAIIQAEQLGTNIANTLRVQANTMRQKRRQRAEQQAMKAPVKMLFPMVFFIFPSLFIVILGPAVIQISQAIMEMF